MHFSKERCETLVLKPREVWSHPLIAIARQCYAYVYRNGDARDVIIIVVRNGNGLSSSNLELVYLHFT